MLLTSKYPADNFRDRALATTVRERRERLANLISFPVLLWSGQRPSRNFPSNTYPFRASSHFLYFAGIQLENAAIRLADGKLELFADDPDPAIALWHGEMPKRHEIARLIGADAAFPLAELESRTADAATVAVQDPETRSRQERLLGRSLHGQLDRKLAKAIVTLRLSHDPSALAQLRQAAAVSVKAHKAGMAATPDASTEAEVRGAMEGTIIAHNMTTAYNSIVTVRGEVLHNEHYQNPLQPGQLLLADVGAETPAGWASDITRTWAVGGRFSPTQRDLYEVVLAAHDRAIEAVRPGVEYRDLHRLATQVIAEGLVELGIGRGDPEGLVERDVPALFFPHGVGHLLGLDVHDMEDLGDLAGYAEGRQRSDRPGLRFLRLDRPVQAGMVFTIEPGFYQVPGILDRPETRSRHGKAVNWERLAQFADVRGIRIEDDVLATEEGSEVLTAALPTNVEAIEGLVQEG